jgi:hypothetical protein
MKRYEHLWERVCSFDILVAEAREALQGQRDENHVRAGDLFAEFTSASSRLISHAF